MNYKKLLMLFCMSTFSLLSMEESKPLTLREKRVQRLKELKARVAKTTADLAENPVVNGTVSIDFAKETDIKENN